MNQPLAGHCILITRPAHQAQPLCQKIEQLGGQTIVFPTLVIADPINKITAAKKIKRLSHCDMVIFTSRNAVQKAVPLLRKKAGIWLKQVQIAAIGESTAEELRIQGFSVDLIPREYNSEGLLQLPQLKKVKNRRILLIRGQGGRNLLSSVLRKRGATVTEAIVYRRLLPQLSANFFPRIQKIDMIISTSNESLQNLYRILGVQHRSWLRGLQLVAVSKRMKDLAIKLGFMKKIIIAENPTDAAIINKIIQERE